MSLHIKLESLQSVLSGAASVYLRDSPEFSSVALRWSEFAAPQPGAIVNVQTEEDVQRTVQWALENGVKFVAQNGSHGWTINWNISESDVIINMRGMNNVNVNLEEGVALVEGGALVHEVVEAAYEAKAHIVVGNCNSVGACGAMLGGGFSRLQANFSMSIDNIISLRLVTAQGELITVSETENSELLWAMKGAGHNFGIVTAALVKAYPQVNGGMHWESNMVFLPDHIEEVTQTINDLHLGTGMSIHYAFIGVDPIVGIPAVVLDLWYAGTPEEGEEVFAPLFALRPIYHKSGAVPYDKINKVLDRGQHKGGQKPTWSVAIPKLDPKAARALWKHYIDFRLCHPSSTHSVIMFECYGFDKVREAPNECSAFPWRDVNFHVCASLFYRNREIDDDANVWGDKFRTILQDSSDTREKKVYVNYATGDEPLQAKYGYEQWRLERLRTLKAQWDPEGRFSHYHPIS